MLLRHQARLHALARSAARVRTVELVSTRVRCAVSRLHSPAVQRQKERSAAERMVDYSAARCAVRQRIVLYASKVCNIRRRRILFEGGQAGERNHCALLRVLVC